MRAKYIVGLVLGNHQDRRLEALVFATTLSHYDAAQMFDLGDLVCGAGFCEIQYRPPRHLTADQSVTVAGKITVEVFGESESLGVKSGTLDQKYVERTLGSIGCTNHRNG